MSYEKIITAGKLIVQLELKEIYNVSASLLRAKQRPTKASIKSDYGSAICQERGTSTRGTTRNENYGSNSR